MICSGGPIQSKTFGLSVECSSNSFDANDIMTEDDIHPSQKTNSSQLERVPKNGAPGPPTSKTTPKRTAFGQHKRVCNVGATKAFCHYDLRNKSRFAECNIYINTSTSYGYSTQSTRPSSTNPSNLHTYKGPFKLYPQITYPRSSNNLSKINLQLERENLKQINKTYHIIDPKYLVNQLKSRHIPHQDLLS